MQIGQTQIHGNADDLLFLFRMGVLAQGPGDVDPGFRR